jgi:hypothetical protein
MNEDDPVVRFARALLEASKQVDPLQWPSLTIGPTTWVPLNYYGETYYQCTVELFGHVAQGVSHRKPEALSYALEELARMVREKGAPNP